MLATLSPLFVASGYDEPFGALWTTARTAAECYLAACASYLRRPGPEALRRAEIAREPFADAVSRLEALGFGAEGMELVQHVTQIIAGRIPADQTERERQIQWCNS